MLPKATMFHAMTNMCARIFQYWHTHQPSSDMTPSPPKTNMSSGFHPVTLCAPYQVCAEGSRSVDRSSRWIWNFCAPFMPCSSLKPCRGTRDVPVTNWMNLARSSFENERSASQNHWICGVTTITARQATQVLPKLCRIVNTFHTDVFAL